MKLVFVQRRPMGAQVSIERLFDGIRGGLSAAVQWAVHQCPEYSRGLRPRWRNVRAAKKAVPVDALAHVTGDVHYVVPALPAARTILTIHDAAILHRLRGLKREVVRRLWFEWPVRRAAAVTTISEFTREDLRRWLPPALHGRIEVIHNPVRDEFTPAARNVHASRPTILQVGTGWNKNLERVARAIVGLDVRLEVVGALSPAQERLLGELRLDFTALGRLGDAELVEAYHRADVVVFASLFEGFGLPVIEAQATGRPVVASRVSSVPEVAGEAACFVDPEDEASIRQGVQQVLGDELLRQRLVEAGLRNVARFRSAEIAARYEALYARLERQRLAPP